MSTTLVTGANRGIGLELTRQLAHRGDHVVAACREPSEELRALGETVRVEKGVDVTSDASCAGLAERLGDLKLDLVIHNAGVLARSALEDPDLLECSRRLFEVNALGPLRLTQALLPRLAKGAKLALVTSRMGSIADNTSGGSYAYRMSKAALNAAGMSLTRDLAARGVAVIILHPGFVRTEMTSGMGNVGPEEAARGLLARIDELTLETSGEFRHANGERLPW